MEAAVKYGIEVSRCGQKPQLETDGDGIVFSVSNPDLLRDYFDAYFSSERAKYAFVDLSQFAGRTHDLTRVIQSQNIL